MKVSDSVKKNSHRFHKNRP